MSPTQFRAGMPAMSCSMLGLVRADHQTGCFFDSGGNGAVSRGMTFFNGLLALDRGLAQAAGEVGLEGFADVAAGALQGVLHGLLGDFQDFGDLALLK